MYESLYWNIWFAKASIMHILGIDIGTTCIKVGLFASNGETLALTSEFNRRRRASEGYEYYDPEELWKTVVGAIDKVLFQSGESGSRKKIAAVGIASMAETGVLVDRCTGEARTPLLPWFERVAATQAEWLCNEVDIKARFCKSGIRPTFKCSLAKILWLKAQDAELLTGAVWLSTADYVAFRLTGKMGTDFSLAGRSYAFDLEAREWDREWLTMLGLYDRLFPEALPAGTPLGIVAHSQNRPPAIWSVPVTITGHDHVCAAYAAGKMIGGIWSDMVFDSIGTAESLVGAFPERLLGAKEYDSGLSFGIHTAPGYLYWMGGLSASGGSVEWLREILNEEVLTYDALDVLLGDERKEPGEVLYLPYLSGSGSPHTNTQVRAAFLGLSLGHTRADLYQAVLEGTAFEMEFIRRAAEKSTGSAIEQLVAAGGGTRNRAWMQIKADVSGCPITALPQAEATVLGAALLAGAGVGLDIKIEIAPDHMAQPMIYEPDKKHCKIYRRRYQAFLAMQEPLRELAGKF